MSIVIVKGGLISEGTIWFPLQKNERNLYTQLNFSTSFCGEDQIEHMYYSLRYDHF